MFIAAYPRSWNETLTHYEVEAPVPWTKTKAINILPHLSPGPAEARGILLCPSVLRLPCMGDLLSSSQARLYLTWFCSLAGLHERSVGESSAGIRPCAPAQCSHPCFLPAPGRGRHAEGGLQCNACRWQGLASSILGKLFSWKLCACCLKKKGPGKDVDGEGRKNHSPWLLQSCSKEVWLAC